ncbi:MAG: hypothetical protein KAH57_03660 [Thermoplasmata archaeon]|nr:hypothetical protein [Thermoplasmata archaeon]
MILKAALIGVVIAAVFGTGLFAMADIPDRLNGISLDWGRGECMDEDYDERHEECEEHSQECDLEDGEEICEEHYDESEDSSNLRGVNKSVDLSHPQGGDLEESIHSDSEECEEFEEEEHCWENGDRKGCVF